MDSAGGQQVAGEQVPNQNGKSNLQVKECHFMGGP
jgi:hypothetical protein